MIMFDVAMSLDCPNRVRRRGDVGVCGDDDTDFGTTFGTQTEQTGKGPFI